jgi:hypothetical protein
MAEVVERLDSVERRLTSVETGLSDLREQVGGLREEVGGLRGDVHKLRILGEKNETDIMQIAEVQVLHGRKLDEITMALAPLARLDAFLPLVADEHEKRITDLERRSRIRE